MQTDLEKLGRLHALFKAGALSETEYQKEKLRLLSPHDASSGWADETSITADQPTVNDANDVTLTVRTWNWSVGIRILVIALAMCVLAGPAYWFLSSAPNKLSDGQVEPSGLAKLNMSSEKPVASEGADIDLPSRSSLLGQPYGEVLAGKPFDPAKGLTSEGYFNETLSGPQTPSVSLRINGKELIVWENCKAQNCPWLRSVIAVEVDGPGRFVATINDGEPEILRNAWFGAELLASCKGATCDFGSAAQSTQTMGRAKDIGTLSDTDLAWAYGGAHCRAENSAGDMVFYTEGEGIIRFKGKLHKVSEDGGIGAGPWSSEEGFNSITVEIEERNGPTRELEEGSSYSAYLKVFDGSYTSIPVTMTCEA